MTAAWHPGDFPDQLADRPANDLVAYLLDQRLPVIADEFPTNDYPFDVIRWHEKLLPGHLVRGLNGAA